MAVEPYRFAPQQQDAMEQMQVPFAVYQFCDMRVVTLVVSAGFCQLFGYDDRQEAYNDMDYDMYRYAHPDDAARVADAAYKFATEGGTYDVIYRSEKMGDRSYRIIHAIGRHVYTPTGERLAYVWYTDEGTYTEGESAPETVLNTSLQNALHTESFFKTSYYDGLTGLPSMSYFFNLASAGIAAMLADGNRPLILFFDLSGMKFYNGKYGFSEGDKLLVSFAKLLVSRFGNENCSRFGQDHFAVYTVADAIESRLEAIFEEWKNRDVANPVIRVGVYADDLAYVDVSTACDMAKIACDRLRNGHTSAYNYFGEEMRNEIKRRQYIVENVDKAIAEQWIQVYYQPIVRAVNGRVCDEEALARWIDPVEGMLSPAEFIPVLEDAGLIYKLDLYVVEQALAKLQLCTDAGLYRVPQSINLSRVDFESCDIVEEIRRRVDASGFGRDMLNIEITESVIGKNFDFMKAQIERFQRLGFQVWMDDFGSGYSSLDVLKDLQFQLIKFDMKFMKELDEGNSGKIILTELMKMATALGVDTICEGVETEDQMRFLREIGCSKMQGYFFAKPMPMSEVMSRCFNHTADVTFEDPREAQYFEQMGRVNLYDLSVLTDGNDSGFNKYFNALPMAIIEVLGDKVRLVRSNQTYREFVLTRFGLDLSQKGVHYADILYRPNSALMNIVNQCTRVKPRAFFDEMLADGSTVHSYARRIGINPKTGDVAIALAVLSIVDSDQGTSYANIARALAADYFNLFYVNVENEQFIEYTSKVGEERMAMERHGEHFFAESRRDAREHLHPEDVGPFVAAFTKERVLREIDEQGAFSLTYRQFIGGTPVYVHMKATRMYDDGRYIIIGVSNIDAQKRQQEALDRIRDERLVYARMAALIGNHICLFTIDVDTDDYYVYHADEVFERFGLPKEGKHFFDVTIESGKKLVYGEDLPQYLNNIDKKKILREIEAHRVFAFEYRLLVDGKPTRVTLRAGMTHEDGKDKLIVGLSYAE